MSVIIGKNYEEKKDELRKRIKKGSISVLEKKAENQACYLCGENISGKMLELTANEAINGHETEAKYFIGLNCYNQARSSEYHHGMRFPLN